MVIVYGLSMGCLHLIVQSGKQVISIEDKAAIAFSPESMARVGVALKHAKESK